MDSIIAEERMYNPNGYFEVIKHMGTGCVFGVKDTVTLNWSFYLQENFRIAYMRAPMQVKWANRVIRLWKISPARVREHHNPIVKRLP